MMNLRRMIELACKFCQSSNTVISELLYMKGDQTFKLVACQRCGKVSVFKIDVRDDTVAVASNFKPEPPQEEPKKEEDENVPSGNEEGMLQQVPLPAEKDKERKRQVQADRLQGTLQ